MVLLLFDGAAAEVFYDFITSLFFCFFCNHVNFIIKVNLFKMFCHFKFNDSCCFHLIDCYRYKKRPFVHMIMTHAWIKIFIRQFLFKLRI